MANEILDYFTNEGFTVRKTWNSYTDHDGDGYPIGDTHCSVNLYINW